MPSVTALNIQRMLQDDPDDLESLKYTLLLEAMKTLEGRKQKRTEEESKRQFDITSGQRETQLEQGQQSLDERIADAQRNYDLAVQKFEEFKVQYDEQMKGGLFGAGYGSPEERKAYLEQFGFSTDPSTKATPTALDLEMMGNMPTSTGGPTRNTVSALPKGANVRYASATPSYTPPSSALNTGEKVIGPEPLYAGNFRTIMQLYGSGITQQPGQTALQKAMGGAMGSLEGSRSTRTKTKEGYTPWGTY